MTVVLFTMVILSTEELCSSNLAEEFLSQTKDDYQTAVISAAQVAESLPAGVLEQTELPVAVTEEDCQPPGQAGSASLPGALQLTSQPAGRSQVGQPSTWLLTY